MIVKFVNEGVKYRADVIFIYQKKKKITNANIKHKYFNVNFMNLA